jgi:hypothetical protein
MTTTRPMSGVVERAPLDDRLQRVGYGPSLRGDERLLRRESGHRADANQLAVSANSRHSFAKELKSGMTGVKVKQT